MESTSGNVLKEYSVIGDIAYGNNEAPIKASIKSMKSVKKHMMFKSAFCSQKNRVVVFCCLNTNPHFVKKHCLNENPVLVETIVKRDKISGKKPGILSYNRFSRTIIDEDTSISYCVGLDNNNIDNPHFDIFTR